MKTVSPRNARFLAASLLFTVTLINSGCLAVGVGAAAGTAVGYAYLKGRVYETYQANLGDTWAATQTALKELGMPILSEERKGTTGTMETRTADNEKVHLYLEALESKFPAEGQLTRLSVRVATFGDTEVSNRVLDQVGFHLVPAGTALQQPALAPQSGQGIVQTGAPALAVPSSPPSQSGTQQTPPPPLSQPEPIQGRK